MKKFHEFVSEKESPAEIKPARPGMFDSGMDSRQVNPTMSALTRLLGSRGVVNRENRPAANMIMRKLRQPILQLIRMGLGPDDVLLAVQEVINLVMGQKNNPMLNRSFVRTKVRNDLQP